MAWSHSIFRDSGVPHLLVGTTGRIALANPAANDLVGRSSLAGSTLADLFTTADRAALDVFLAELATLPAGRSHVLGPVHLRDRTRRRPVQVIGSRTHADEGFDVLVLALYELPTTSGGSGGEPVLLVDPLTGTGTRARGLRELQQVVRPGAPGCLLVIDVDGFGWINDSLGSAEGDRILREVARRLLRAVPPRASVARIDGDQFLVVSATTPVAQWVELAGIVISAISKPMHIAGTRVVTVSIGVAGLAGVTVDEVLTRAKAALDVAREQGGQQVVVDGPTKRTYGRRQTDMATALRELLTDAQRARSEAEQAQVEVARAQTAAQRAHLEARTCPMTGLPNYLAYREAAAQLQEDARRSSAPFSVVFLDLDRFGSINKSLSWEQGTRTLAEVARVLESERRDEDRLFRYGGEEFVVLLPGIDLAGARAVAERLRESVEAARIPHNGLPEQPIVTLSVGVAAGSGPRLVISDLVNDADELSQLAKARGRNRVLPEAATTSSDEDAD